MAMEAACTSDGSCLERDQGGVALQRVRGRARREIVEMSTTKNERENIRILVVDDFSSIRKILRKLLASLGFVHVAEARDASEAVYRLQHDSFDLIISDWNMPTMTGKQLLDFVRSQERLEKIPFIMLTMQTDRESVLSAKKAGVSHYLAKPFTAAELESKLSELLPSYRDK
jgi:two-component system chemotaxis response regulator CheY